jgi:hypothetical protein
MGKSNANRNSDVKTRLILPRNGRTLRRHSRKVKASILPRRQFLRLAAGAAALPAIAPHVKAQSYPSRPITMIVPFAAGGTNDVAARILAERMRQSLGQPIIIENGEQRGRHVGAERLSGWPYPPLHCQYF